MPSRATPIKLLPSTTPTPIIMHFANDALWWRLTHPTVRELAALLLAPELYPHPNRLPHRQLLGSTGFRQILQLNDHPTHLPTDHTPNTLLCFWLNIAEHIELIEQNHNAYHIKIGTNKYTIQLHHHSHATADTPPPTPTHHTLITRGIVFLPPTNLPNAPFAINAWHGTHLPTWHTLPDDDTAHYQILPNTPPLAPTVHTHAYNRNEILTQIQAHQTFIAKMQHRPDGQWHEIERFYCPTS